MKGRMQTLACIFDSYSFSFTSFIPLQVYTFMSHGRIKTLACILYSLGFLLFLYFNLCTSVLIPFFSVFMHEKSRMSNVKTNKIIVKGFLVMLLVTRGVMSFFTHFFPDFFS